MIWSLACALSKTMIQLIIFRALQGIGGGGLVTSVWIISSDIVSLRERGVYQSILQLVILISTSLGPILGGALSSVSWTREFCGSACFERAFCSAGESSARRRRTWPARRKADLCALQSSSGSTYRSELLPLL